MKLRFQIYLLINPSDQQRRNTDPILRNFPLFYPFGLRLINLHQPPIHKRRHQPPKRRLKHFFLVNRILPFRGRRYSPFQSLPIFLIYNLNHIITSIHHTQTHIQRRLGNMEIFQRRYNLRYGTHAHSRRKIQRVLCADIVSGEEDYAVLDLLEGLLEERFLWRLPGWGCLRVGDQLLLHSISRVKNGESLLVYINAVGL